MERLNGSTCNFSQHGSRSSPTAPASAATPLSRSLNLPFSSRSLDSRYGTTHGLDRGQRQSDAVSRPQTRRCYRTHCFRLAQSSYHVPDKVSNGVQTFIRRFTLCDVLHITGHFEYTLALSGTEALRLDKASIRFRHRSSQPLRAQEWIVTDTLKHSHKHLRAKRHSLDYCPEYCRISKVARRCRLP
jgi:hypothetical protein